MTKLLRILLSIITLTSVMPLAAQRVAVSTNALEWATGAPNLRIDTRLSRRVTFDIAMGGNPFNEIPYFKDYGLKNLHLTPSLRYWFNRPMARHFVGLNFTAAVYNVKFKDDRYKGDLFAVGVDYGYALVLSRRWNVEFSAGIGIGKARGYEYKTYEPQPEHTNMSKWVPVPRVGVTFSYMLK